MDWVLLYRGTEHGMSPDAYHDRCDFKGPTLTLVHNSFNKVFGGFTMLELDYSVNYKIDRDAFIFSFDKNEKYMSKKG